MHNIFNINIYKKRAIYVSLAMALVTTTATNAAERLKFAPPQKINLNLPEANYFRYISPHAVDWNNDGANDLLIGLVSGTKKVGDLVVRLYINHGSNAKPRFTDYSLLKDSSGTSIKTGHTCCGAPCMAVMDLNGDNKKDLLVASNRIRIYMNIGTDVKPQFGKVAYINVDGKVVKFTCHGYPSIVDWNNDGKQDIIYSMYLFDNTGKINALINKGSNAMPKYLPNKTIKSSPGNDIFPHRFAAVVVFDLDQDGKKDLIIGQYKKDGLVWYKNIGSNNIPKFNGFKVIKDIKGNSITMGSVIRPQIVKWDDDDIPDLIIGASSRNNNAVWFLKGLR